MIFDKPSGAVLGTSCGGALWTGMTVETRKVVRLNQCQEPGVETGRAVGPGQGTGLQRTGVLLKKLRAVSPLLLFHLDPQFISKTVLAPKQTQLSKCAPPGGDGRTLWVPGHGPGCVCQRCQSLNSRPRTPSRGAQAQQVQSCDDGGSHGLGTPNSPANARSRKTITSFRTLESRKRGEQLALDLHLWESSYFFF